MPEFFAVIRWIQAHSILVVMSTFVAMALWTFWPSHKKQLESHGAIPLRDDRLGD
ncbi:MAG: CcoQ/FixQ family Cbb3-type cytochrome c oxidase assembly chaperone [Elsteraceae bacterium]